MLPEISAKNCPGNSWWAYFHSDGKKIFPIYVAGIIPIGPGRRYTLSIYFTTTTINRDVFHLLLHRGRGLTHGKPMGDS